MAKQVAKKGAKKVAKPQGTKQDSDSDDVANTAATSESNGDEAIRDTVAPTTAAKGKDKAATSKKTVKANEEKQSNVIFLGGIPHAFDEDHMRHFFKKYGTAKRIRLTRKKRTATSKNFAFIEFESAEVAGVVARAMDSYRMSDSVLSSYVLPAAAVHERMLGRGGDLRSMPRTAGPKRG